jgi:hypothetical protein
MGHGYLFQGTAPYSSLADVIKCNPQEFRTLNNFTTGRVLLLLLLLVVVLLVLFSSSSIISII